MPTFAEAAAAVVEQKQAGWKNAEQVRAWRNSLRRYAFPRIGTRPVSEVESADVLAILSPIWHAKPVIAKTVRQRIHAVLEWAIAMNLRNDNPADRVRPVLGPQRNIVEHMRALPHREVSAALAAVRASRKQPLDKLAFKSLVLTAARSGEVRWARWDEMDTARRVWTLSAQRMKMKRDHRVPLCGRAVAILDEARTLPGAGPLVFSPGGGRPLDVMRFRRLLKRCRIACPMPDCDRPAYGVPVPRPPPPERFSVAESPAMCPARYRRNRTPWSGVGYPTVVGEAQFSAGARPRSHIHWFADRRRRNPTPAERALGEVLNHLNNGVLRGRFRREHAVSGKWIVDFFFPEIRLAIEVDGSVHLRRDQQKRDRLKDADCARFDVTVLRLRNHEVFGSRERLIRKLRDAWLKAKRRRNHIVGTPVK